MVFDFAARPPEVNSTLIYTGAGAGPMMAAAVVVQRSELGAGTNAAAYESVIQQLRVGVDRDRRRPRWPPRPSRTSNGCKPPPRSCRKRPRRPPPRQRRTRRHSLPPSRRPWCSPTGHSLRRWSRPTSSGQNTPAIAANEAMYGEFWAQDATAMSTYAANAATAAQVTPLTEPTQSTNPGGAGAQSAAVANAVNSNAANSGLNGLLSSLQGASSAAATPAASVRRALTSLYGAIQGFWGIPWSPTVSTPLDVTLSWCIMMMASAMGTLPTSRPALPSVSPSAMPHRWAPVSGFGTTLAGLDLRCGRRHAGRHGHSGRGRRDVGAGRLERGRPGCHSHRGHTGRHRLDRGHRREPPPVRAAPRASCRAWLPPAASRAWESAGRATASSPRSCRKQVFV